MKFLDYKYKKIIYILCAAAFMMIEFVRNNTNGDGWAVGNNYIGLVVLVMILLNCNLKEGCIRLYIAETAAAFGAIAFIIVYGSLNPGIYFTAKIVAIALNVWWIVVIASHYVCLIVKKYKPGKELIKDLKDKIRRNPLSFAEIVLCLLSVIWVLVGNSGVFWPVWFFFMFGLFYATRLSSVDISVMTDGLATGTVWSFLALEFGFMPFRPYDDVRYVGFMCNSNCFAILIEIVSLMTLVKILQFLGSGQKGKKRTPGIIFYSAVECFLSLLIFMTGCRTVWVIHFLIIAIYFIGILIFRCKFKAKKVLLSLAGGIIFTALMLYPTYLVIRYVPTIHPHPIWFNGEYSEAKVHSFDPADSEKFVSFEELMDNNLGRLAEMFKFAEKSSSLTIMVHAKDSETEEVSVPYTVYSDSLPWSVNIRLNYFKAYISKFNLLGNNYKNDTFFVDMEDGDKIQIYHAQNLWIQMIYQFGIPFGIMMFAVFMIQFVKAFRILFKGRDFYSVLPALLYIVYFIYGLVELTWLPGYLLFTFIFLIQHPDFKEHIAKQFANLES